MAHHTFNLSADVIDPCISQVISFVWDRFSESSVWRTQENRLLHKGGFLIYKYYDVDYSAPPVISHGDGWVTNMLSMLELDTDI